MTSSSLSYETAQSGTWTVKVTLLASSSAHCWVVPPLKPNSICAGYYLASARHVR